MLKRRRSHPLLPYANVKPVQHHSQTSVVFKRSLITVLTLLTFAFCGHAVFATSSSAAKQKVTDTVLDASLSLSRERSARGLAEQDIAESTSVSPQEVEPQIPVTSSPAYLPPELDLADSSPSHVQNHLVHASKQDLQQAPSLNTSPSPQTSETPHLSPLTHKQTLQEAHAEAQQHFQHAHPIATDRDLVPPISPVAYGIYAMTVEDIDGNQRSLGEFAGKVAVVVNVASSCGFTESNYRGLQFLYEKYKDYDFTVLAFPCNQFGQQEAGSNQDIKQFAKDKYGITFPMFSKIDVNGPQGSMLFRFLKQNMPAALALSGAGDYNLDWNFNKFLVGRNGMPLKHYPSHLDYAQLEQDVYDELVRTQNA